MKPFVKVCESKVLRRIPRGAAVRGGMLAGRRKKQMMRRAIIALPVKARDLETALHAACDSGHWEGEVQIVLDKNINQYRLELVTEE